MERVTRELFWGDGNSLRHVLGNRYKVYLYTYNYQKVLNCLLRSVHFIDVNYTSLKMKMKRKKVKVNILEKGQGHGNI